MYTRGGAILGAVVLGLLQLLGAAWGVEPESIAPASGESVAASLEASPNLPVDRATMATGLARALAGSDEAVPAHPLRTSFSDVSEAHWAYKYIEYVRALGVVSGYQDGTYKPEAPVDRGQMAVFVARALVVPAGEVVFEHYLPPSPQTFSDVGPEHWGYRQIEYLAEPTRSIAQGLTDGKFHPELVCTRREMAAFLARAFPPRPAEVRPPTPSEAQPKESSAEEATPASGQEEVPPRPK